MLACVPARAQDSITDFMKKIKAYDLAPLWTTDSIQDGEGISVERIDPLGFIDDQSYQRFYIHFTSVKKKKNAVYEYEVKGKTKIGKTIHTFTGSLKVLRSLTQPCEFLPQFTMGFVLCDVDFKEDSAQPGAGAIAGQMTTDFVLDAAGQMRYDALMMEADGYSNDEFMGRWTSYKGNISKKCNWGVNHIPECGELDSGNGVFIPNEKYLGSGWENYYELVMGNFATEEELMQAQRKELEKWWK